MGLLREWGLSWHWILDPHICPLCFHFIQVFRVNSSILLNFDFELLDRVVRLYNEFYSFLLPSLLSYSFSHWNTLSQQVLSCLRFVCDPLDLFKVLFLSTTDGRLFNETREASVATPLKKMTPPPPESQSSIIFLYSNTMSYI